MARYKLGGGTNTGLPEMAEAILMALHLVELQCRTAGESGVGDIFLPGRAISQVLGGKWSTYRHRMMLKLEENGWVKAIKGYERGSGKKEVWRYSLTVPAKATLADRLSRASRDCIWDYAPGA